MKVLYLSFLPFVIGLLSIIFTTPFSWSKTSVDIHHRNFGKLQISVGFTPFKRFVEVDGIRIRDSHSESKSWSDFCKVYLEEDERILDSDQLSACKKVVAASKVMIATIFFAVILTIAITVLLFQRKNFDAQHVRFQIFSKYGPSFASLLVGALYLTGVSIHWSLSENEIIALYLSPLGRQMQTHHHFTFGFYFAVLGAICILAQCAMSYFKPIQGTLNNAPAETPMYQVTDIQQSEFPYNQPPNPNPPVVIVSSA